MVYRQHCSFQTILVSFVQRIDYFFIISHWNGASFFHSNRIYVPINTNTLCWQIWLKFTKWLWKWRINFQSKVNPHYKHCPGVFWNLNEVEYILNEDSCITNSIIVDHLKRLVGLILFKVPIVRRMCRIFMHNPVHVFNPYWD